MLWDDIFQSKYQEFYVCGAATILKKWLQIKPDSNVGNINICVIKKCMHFDVFIRFFKLILIQNGAATVITYNWIVIIESEIIDT